MVQNNSSEYLNVLDALLPCLITFGSSTRVFQVTITLLYFLGDFSQGILPVGEPYKRLVAARDFAGVIQQVAIASMDKIPFLSRLIHSYSGTHISEENRVKIFLDLKFMISGTAKDGCEFMFFLAAFNAIQDYPIHSTNGRMTLFHQSECLTVLNSYKSFPERRILAVQKQAATESSTITITSADIPALESSATLHIIASMISSNVDISEIHMSNLLYDAIKMHFKIVLNIDCPIHFQKAYINLIVCLLEGTKLSKERTWEAELIADAVQILANIMQSSTGDVLRTGD